MRSLSDAFAFRGEVTRMIENAARGMFRGFVVTCLLSMSTQPVRAAMACPVMLFDGRWDQDGAASLTFMNTGKIPIRYLEFNCTPPNPQAARRSPCHTESGIFYPGTPYRVRLDYASKGSQSIRVSLKMAQLADGPIWTAEHDQSCRLLNIFRHAKR